MRHWIRLAQPGVDDFRASGPSASASRALPDQLPCFLQAGLGLLKLPQRRARTHLRHVRSLSALYIRANPVFPFHSQRDSIINGRAFAEDRYVQACPKEQDVRDVGRARGNNRSRRAESRPGDAHAQASGRYNVDDPQRRGRAHVRSHVIELLIKLFGHSIPTAEEAHPPDPPVRGRAIVLLTTHREKAELKREQVVSYGPRPADERSPRSALPLLHLSRPATEGFERSADRTPRAGPTWPRSVTSGCRPRDRTGLTEAGYRRSRHSSPRPRLVAHARTAGTPEVTSGYASLTRSSANPGVRDATAGGSRARLRAIPGAGVTNGGSAFRQSETRVIISRRTTGRSSLTRYRPDGAEASRAATTA